MKKSCFIVEEWCYNDVNAMVVQPCATFIEHFLRKI